MPGIITHYLCGLEAIQRTTSPDVKSLATKYLNIFNLGTQGPDFLFYHKAWPWMDNEGIPDIGKLLHRKRIKNTFSAMLGYIASQGESERGLLLAYMLGYMSHYILDAHAHPYVYYKTGFVRNSQDDPLKYVYYHRLFETNIDVIMLRRLLDIKPSSLNVPGIIRISDSDAKIIGQMFEHVICKAHGEKITASQIVTSINDMYSIQRKLGDPTGLKKIFISMLEHVKGSYPLISSMIYPQEVSDGIDYLNLKKNIWRLPWDESVEYTSSFPDIFNDALRETLNIYEIFPDYIQGSHEYDKLIELLGNKSFTTGADCDLDIEFKYFECIFE